MRDAQRKLRVVRVDGSPGWSTRSFRVFLPVLIGLAIPPPIGPGLGFGLVRGVVVRPQPPGMSSDKLAKTLVVAA